MAFRGERFVLDLDDEASPPEDPTPSPFSLVGEIKERESIAATAPKPPTPTASTTGFPAHRQRKKFTSFKQRQAEKSAVSNNPTQGLGSPPVQDDKQSIAEENSRHLASMSDAQVEQERDELLESMDQSLLERFLRRAKINADEEFTGDFPQPALDNAAASTSKKSVSFDIPSANNPPPKAPRSDVKESSKPYVYDDAAPTQVPEDLRPASEYPSLDPATIEKFHFPQPKQPRPILDPSSPNFLSDLQSHYFPEMTHNPSALSWMQPLTSDKEDPDSTSAYHPDSEAISVAPSALRFSLVGKILPPSVSLSLPTNLGLHHHGQDPHAAGYTIPELAILSRSTFPAQRCISWQVLGRILFRLGSGEFGERGGPLSEGLWFCIEKEGVVAGMLAESEGASGQSIDKSRGKSDAENDVLMPSGIGRHASAAAWAVEGVWLWQKSGGGDRGLLKKGQIRSN
ncbi:hypothetical protein N7495_009782 [Penicillium taxi]|uniref:uncharacterized protein n=1 Tax=Penicillium taxi TaxID=168475 RepID=UPI0025456109|nr:uncharacterized protein N7495_009782 [Penicillium taxi]KAJ5885272.1 hypothetical protein N7495_009782 [Penicillium taxi]